MNKGKSSEHAESPWLQFRNLCDYYADCVKFSERRQEYLFPDQLNNAFIVPRLPLDWHLSSEPYDIETSPEQHPACNLLLSPELDDDIYIGYPVAAFTTSNEKKTRCLCPIGLFPVEVSVRGDNWLSGLKIKPDVKGFELNREWFEFRVPESKRPYVMKSIDRMVDGEGNIDIDCALQFIRNHFGVTIDPNNLKMSIREEDAEKEILNSAVLFIGSKGQYTKNLIRELRQIRRAPDGILDRTALAYVFRNPPLPVKTPTAEDWKIAASFTENPLNNEQIKAVEHALNFPVTKVTGPPGTGKSHMAVNLIASEIYYGGSVLFSSKNHKAIHAIFEKCAGLVPNAKLDPVLFCTQPSVDEDVPQPPIGAERRPSRQIGGSDVVRWYELRDRFEKRIDESACFRHRESETDESPEEPEEIRFPSIMEVDDALQTFRDAKEKVTAYENLRLKLSAIQSLFDRIEQTLSRVPLPDRVDSEFLRLLKDVLDTLAATKDRHAPGFWHRLVMKLLRRSPQTDVRAKLLKQYPCLGSEITSLPHLLSRGRSLLRVLKFRELVRRFEALELESLREREKDYNYETLLSELGEARKHLCENCNRALQDKILQRLMSLPDKCEPVSELKGAMRNLEIDNHPALVSFQTGEGYDEALDCMKNMLAVQPAWAVTLLSLKNASPCLPAVFSLALIDEASQCDIPPMIPALFRAQRIAVVGDPDQFPPVITLREARNTYFMAKHAQNTPISEKYSYTTNNVFSVVPCSSIKLREHFRCTDAIAGYCNTNYYNGSLIPSVGDREKDRNGKAINWSRYGIKPGMEWLDAVGGDEQEIAAAVKYLKGLHDRTYTGTVGVISPLRKVVARLKERLYKEQNVLPKNFKLDTGVNTANGFQGGECDIILFLLGMNNDREHGQLWYITDDSNRYIFNVSVSRARICFVGIGDRDRALHSGKRYISGLIPNQSTHIDTKVGPGEILLREALLKAGIETAPQYPACNRWLDLAIPEKKIDIEVDGQAWHLDKNGCRKADDVYRDLLMQSQGWTVIRFWHHEVVGDVAKCVDKVRRVIES